MINQEELTPVKIGGEELLTPEAVSRYVSEQLGAEFSLRQVSRLGDNKIIEPVLFKRRRWYRRKDVERLLRKGHIVVSRTDKSVARLVRQEVREKSERARR